MYLHWYKIHLHVCNPSVQVPSRTADIKPDRDEDATKEGEATFQSHIHVLIYMHSVQWCMFMFMYLNCAAQGEFEETSSYTNRLEEMRKTGGDKWLSLLTADRTKQSIDSSASVSYLLNYMYFSMCCSLSFLRPYMYVQSAIFL